MSLKDVRDQEVPLRLLGRVLGQRRVPHGFLFWGPEGVGKRYTALEFAKALNCQEAQADACDECLQCRKVAHGNHPDVKFIAPSSKGREILKDTIDFINELAAYRPFEGEYRTVIIEEADRMRIESQNHFLKTLEEPPSRTVFILISANSGRLLPTIRSRCQQVRFGALHPNTVTELLQAHRDIDRATAEAIAAVSQGQVSRALDLVDSEKRPVMLDILARLERGDDPLVLSEEFAGHLKERTDAVRASVKAEEDPLEVQEGTREDLEAHKAAQEALINALVRRDLMEYLYLLESWYRDVLVAQAVGDEKHVLNRDRMDGLQAASAHNLDAKFSAIEKAWLYIERNLRTERVFRDLFCALAK